MVTTRCHTSSAAASTTVRRSMTVDALDSLRDAVSD
jgi:hypothetical protein